VTSAGMERQPRPRGARRPRFDLVEEEEITAGPRATRRCQATNHADGAVMVCTINEVNDRPVGKPQEQGVMNIAASFALVRNQGYQSSRRPKYD
jgi:hypothetical protein